MPDKPRYTITGTYLNQKKPDNEFAVKSPWGTPRGRIPMLRMSWDFPQPKCYVSSSAVAKAIRESVLPDAHFFLDTCFLTTPLDQEVWEAVLSRKVYITPLVRKELTPFLETPYCNAFARETILDAFANGDPRIVETTVNELQSMPGYRYYMELLLLRKAKGIQFGNELSLRLGHAPAKNEFIAEFKKLVSGFDDRAVRLAWKGWLDHAKPNFAADEQIVVTAVLHALSTGKETVILTRDHDLQEQFYKLIFLIDTHYRSMLFAQHYRNSERNHFSQSMLDIQPTQFRDSLASRFHLDNGIAIAPDLPQPEGWNSVLPPEHGTVMTECWWFGDGPTDLQLCRMPFCADLNMNAVAVMKECHDGSNTDQFGDRNCHIWPCPGLRLMRTMVVIAKDRVSNIAGWKLRSTDALHALTSREGYAKVWIDGDDSNCETPGS